MKNKIFITKNFKNNSIKDLDNYKKLYKYSIENPSQFWSEIAEKQISWFQKWHTTQKTDFVNGDIKYFEGGKLNLSYNCLDRHVENGHGNKTALIWEGNTPGESKKFSYAELLDQVQKIANVLKNTGIKKGDRVCIYMQMIPELAVAVLACSRIGAVHSVVFGAFSAESLSSRINACQCKILITQDFGIRGKKQNIPMKENADKAVKQTSCIQNIIVVKRTENKVNMENGRDLWWHQETSKINTLCPPEVMDSEDPLFILYTSGSTGKPKGILHTTGGYGVYASYTHKQIFNYQEGDVSWCTADIGWITGHSYVIYGPLINRATTLMFEGTPNYPDFGRYWSIIEQHKVNIFYTAPTALRALMKEGNSWPEKYDLSTLKVLGSVGEPIKEPEWVWYYNIIGKGKCPIADTWWQTETGGVLISPLPGITKLKPGYSSLPFFGIQPILLDDHGKEITTHNTPGLLAIKAPWPGMLRTIYGDNEKFKQLYFSKYPGYFLTGDSAYFDKDKHFRITGRVDDVLNVSGHRIGTAELEEAIAQTKGVAEAAVVSFEHEIKGEGIHAFVSLMHNTTPNLKLKEQIKITVAEKIGPHAKPDRIKFVSELPKTRSGKIIRRLLRSISLGNSENFGDLSTLANPSIIKELTL
jgi:acetyl-CoA synthetase